MATARRIRIRLSIRTLHVLIGVLSLCLAVSGQERKHIPISVEDVLKQQASKDAVPRDLNERIRSMAAVSRYSQDYFLGPGDVLEVTVFGIEDLKKRELTLDSEGKITLPFIRDVKLIGLTSREAEVKIATLFEASVMKSPQVSVEVKQHKSQFINVLGAVFKPGTYQLTRRVFLVDALAMAGGLMAEKAEWRVYIHRASDGGETADSAAARSPIDVDLVQLLEKGDVSLNVPVYAGDVVSIPERVERFFYVLGDVNKAGAFEIKRGEKITLSKALASAGGLMPTAKASKTTVMRPNADGRTTSQMPVDVTRLLKGQTEDFVLGQNDVVFVPGSTTKTVGRGVLNGIGGVMAAIVYAGMVR